MANALEKELIDYKKKLGINENNISEDHIIKIDPNKEIVLALDEDGNELCRFAFEIDGKLVTYKSPALRLWQGFSAKMRELLILLSKYAENVEVPKDKAEMLNNNPTAMMIWKMMGCYALLSVDKVKDLVLIIFFKYLEGSIEGIEKSRFKSFHKSQIKWFLDNARVTDVEKIFSAMLAVDDLIKKNAIFILEKEFQKLQGQNLKNSSTRKPESPSLELIHSQSSTLESL